MVDKKILDEIGVQMIKKAQTIAVAESVTAGLLQLSLSNIKDARKFFQGGITAFNLGQKYKHLSVEPISAEACNCVSEIVAEQMAANICKLFNSDWGIGITGYASKVPESEDKIFCYYAIAKKKEIITQNKLVAGDNVEEGMEAQIYFAQKVFTELNQLIK